MKIGIMTMESHENRTKNSVGSSRIRGNWLLKYWPEAEIYQIGKQYDVIIFQKAYFERYMQEFNGIKILDVCDPDWLDGRPIKTCIEMCDAVTCSSEKLADFIRTITDKPVYWVPDRMDLEYYNQQKVHQGKAQSVVWFGYSNNFEVLNSALHTIKRLGLKLTIIADNPYFPPGNIEGIDTNWIASNVTNVRYDQDSVNEELLRHDIGLNPRIEVGRFKYKSNNKTLTFWALGMPVATNSEELERFMDEVERKKEAELRLKEMKDRWHTALSVDQYKVIIDNIIKLKSK